MMPCAGTASREALSRRATHEQAPAISRRRAAEAAITASVGGRERWASWKMADRGTGRPALSVPSRWRRRHDASSARHTTAGPVAGSPAAGSPAPSSLAGGDFRSAGDRRLVASHQDPRPVPRRRPRRRRGRGYGRRLRTARAPEYRLHPLPDRRDKLPRLPPRLRARELAAGRRQGPVGRYERPSRRRRVRAPRHRSRSGAGQRAIRPTRPMMIPQADAAIRVAVSSGACSHGRASRNSSTPAL